MPTLIDSVFLDLGIDTSKFSTDQRAALKKIAEFESQAKRSAKKTSDSITSIGTAFRDIGKISAGAGSPLGTMAKGLGMLLSPATLGVAAVSLLGKEVFDFNKNLTDSNATLARNAELTGMSATNLWSMGQAVKTVGGNPEAVQASIASLQTAFAGMSIGVGSAVPQMIGMARLRGFGARFNPGGFGKGVDEESLFNAVHGYYLKNGRAKTMALVTGYGLMGADQANLAMSEGGFKEYRDAQDKAASMRTGGGFEAVVRKSLQSQVGIGEKDIVAAITAEQAYGGIQGGMQSVIGLLTNIYGVLNAILGFVSRLVPSVSTVKSLFTGASGADVDAILNSRSPKLPKSAADRMALGKKLLMSFGMSEQDAAATIGNQMQESSMDPMAFNGSHRGIGQWDKTRAAAFAKRFGYEIGSFSVSQGQQFVDQEKFTTEEAQYRIAAAAMAKAQGLSGKTAAFMGLDEIVKDGSFSKRLAYARQALSGNNHSIQHNDNSSDIRIGDINLYTSATDPAGLASALRNGLKKQPLLNPIAQGTVSLGTRAME